MRTYIAGPMDGYLNLNFDAFDKAYCELWQRGYVAISPADLDRLFEGFEQYPPEDLVVDDELKRRVMRRDLAAIFECEAIYLLHGWKGSEGVAVELALAKYLGLEILYQDVDKSFSCILCGNSNPHKLSCENNPAWREGE